MMNNMLLTVFPGMDAHKASAFALLVLWSLFWKGLALWHAGRRDQPVWFIIMLLINIAGIVEIIYLFFVLKLKFSQLFSGHVSAHHHE